MKKFKKSSDAINREDSLWYLDAVIYQLHVKAFFDSSGDGIGDFPGLIEKLDYLKDMGVTALWLLPFYPSPLRDDGYDIANYHDVNSAYGTMRDFRRFIQACHERNLRLITELVVNHTSDQHPWFKRAREAPAGSNHRNYYVWSDTDQTYQGTEIIFLDTETSNWAWDPVAKAYYWHRFYSHQPDLNYDNPEVLREVLRIMNYWLDMGVDGMRLDAVPYLIEREGTNNENLPETHAILRQIRAEIDAKFPDRMLLAEANQWPENVLPYFGNGDECHMAFHFPLMPRMYMAIAQEDRHPITDIMRQTPDTPPGCQWAIFLRNHDELTLAMVTDKERDYLWNFYAMDRRSRINLGIRRRLAPLMENDRRKIELMNGLLLSLPGTPIIYYGDEIGMGDNIYLGDRDGVRTPMQWSPDRNGGFSRADPAKLYLPPIMDPIYGFQAVNVEAQLHNASSLLNWTKRLLAVRQSQNVFGRGSLEFLYPKNRKILAYLRRHEDRIVLCVFNLSRSAQAVELNLSSLKGHVPIELTGRSAFPIIEERPYILTLPGYAFHWFLLAESTRLPTWHQPAPESSPELITFVIKGAWTDIINLPNRALLERDILSNFIQRQHWRHDQDTYFSNLKISEFSILEENQPATLLLIVDALLPSGQKQKYFLPLSVIEDNEALGADSLTPLAVAQIRRGRRIDGIYDAAAVHEFPLFLLAAMRKNLTIPSNSGFIKFQLTSSFEEISINSSSSIRRLDTEQESSCFLIDEEIVLKIYRKLFDGPHPEITIDRYLLTSNFRNTPSLLGTIEHLTQENQTLALGIAQKFIRNQGNGWAHAYNYLIQHLERHVIRQASGQIEATENKPHQFYISLIKMLGQRIAELHQALSRPTENSIFSPESITAADLSTWIFEFHNNLEKTLKLAESRHAELSEPTHTSLDFIHARKEQLLTWLEVLSHTSIPFKKFHIHGDLRLENVLLAQNDWYIINFEKNQKRTTESVADKQPALRDIASVLWSLNSVAFLAVQQIITTSNIDTDILQKEAEAWCNHITNELLSSYWQSAKTELANNIEWKQWLCFFLLEKACQEISHKTVNSLNFSLQHIQKTVNQLISS